MYTSKTTEEKKPWEIARDVITPMAVKKLKSFGIDGVKDKNVFPKNIQNTTYDAFDHLLIKPFEFSADLYFVLTSTNWLNIVDKNGMVLGSVSSPKAESIKLYKLPACDNFDDVYAFTDFGGTKTKLTGCYKVPTSDLIEVGHEAKMSVDLDASDFSKPTAAEFEFPAHDEEENDDDADANINTMTIKDLYAIMQNVPVSNKPWLNKVIKKVNVIRTKKD